MCWKELSPVFSFTHWMPFGEKMENPDDEPARFSTVQMKTSR
jgi:hypothetical protein